MHYCCLLRNWPPGAQNVLICVRARPPTIFLSCRLDARYSRHQGSPNWFVLADPEGNATRHATGAYP